MVDAADDQGVCRLTQQTLGERIGAAERTVRRLLERLETTLIDDHPMVTKKRGMDGYEFNVTIPTQTGQKVPISITISFMSLKDYFKELKDLKDVESGQKGPQVIPSAEQKQKTKTPTPTAVVFAYWCDAYKTRYQTDYRVSNFGRENGQIKRLIAKYDNDATRVKALIDVVMRLYDTKWKTGGYTRPTIGSFTSWIAPQAEAYVLAADTPVQTPADDGTFDLAAYNGEFGLDGVSV